uniref:Uncharacterized protein n=1 Tax=Lepeophtheirus salmonis TaxID=72036 RepID=A0A0K2UV35_LEPSM
MSWVISRPGFNSSFFYSHIVLTSLIQELISL